MGLVNKVCEPAQTESSALQACARLSAQPPAAIRATRELLNRANGEELKTTMLAEGKLFAERLKSPENAEAIKAFTEKRKPDFSNFS
jgi:enoyl-CoA hydratase/carnithine racemase